MVAEPDGPFESEDELDGYIVDDELEGSDFDGDQEIEQDESADPGTGGNMGDEEGHPDEEDE